MGPFTPLHSAALYLLKSFISYPLLLDSTYLRSILGNPSFESFDSSSDIFLDFSSRPEFYPEFLSWIFPEFTFDFLTLLGVLQVLPWYEGNRIGTLSVFVRRFLFCNFSDLLLLSSSSFFSSLSTGLFSDLLHSIPNFTVPFSWDDACAMCDEIDAIFFSSSSTFSVHAIVFLHLNALHLQLIWTVRPHFFLRNLQILSHVLNRLLLSSSDPRRRIDVALESCFFNSNFYINQLLSLLMNALCRQECLFPESWGGSWSWYQRSSIPLSLLCAGLHRSSSSLPPQPFQSFFFLLSVFQPFPAGGYTCAFCGSSFPQLGFSFSISHMSN